MKVRKFQFDHGGTMTEIRDAIAQALDDEGLFLLLGQGERLVCVEREIDGVTYDVVCIPNSRIYPKWEGA